MRGDEGDGAPVNSNRQATSALLYALSAVLAVAAGACTLPDGPQLLLAGVATEPIATGAVTATLLGAVAMLAAGLLLD